MANFLVRVLVWQAPPLMQGMEPKMAQRTVVQLVDDIDGTQIADNQGETVTFGLDGATYEIDLTDQNAKELRGAVQVYVANGRRGGGGWGGGWGGGGAAPPRPSRDTGTGTGTGSGPTGRRDPEQTRAIKEWARANG